MLRGESISIFEDLFYDGKYPKIICDSDGKNCKFNKVSNNMFVRDRIESIYEIFPDLNLTEEIPHFIANDFNGDKHTLRCKFFKDSGSWLISVDREQFSDWELFIEDQRILHHIYLDLCKCKTEKEIYRNIVECSLKFLDLDRVGILLLSVEDDSMQGSWGTDDKRNVVDQSDYKSNLKKMDWGLDSIIKKDCVAVKYDSLWNRDRCIGQGWNALATFFDGDKPIGWIACDNFFNKRPLYPWKKEILGELGRVLGQLVSKLRQETRLQELVSERTKELKESQKNLVEAEKLASLGGLVAGVAHELNTPVGVALTAVSYMAGYTEEINIKFDNNRLKKNDLIKYIEDQMESSRVALSSLERAGSLINTFKLLAADQSAEDKRLFSLKLLIDALFNSIKLNYRNINLKLNNSIDNHFELYSYSSDFVQIFTHLIENSIVHGFNNMDSGEMWVEAKIKNENLIINFSDNGKGIPKEQIKKVFEPFYTTGRHKGDTGLGLSIIHNVIVMLGGKIEVEPATPGLIFKMTFDYNNFIQS